MRGKIVQIAPDISEEAEAELDAAGAYVFQGSSMPTWHFNEPGRTEWEGLASGPLPRWQLAAARVFSTCRSTPSHRCSTPPRCA